jgi:hypothetical protein
MPKRHLRQYSEAILSKYRTENEADGLTLKDGTYKLSRNVGTELSFYAT